MSQEPPQKFSAIYFMIWVFHDQIAKMYQNVTYIRKAYAK
jgi:hypothetical protein